MDGIVHAHFFGNVWIAVERIESRIMPIKWIQDWFGFPTRRARNLRFHSIQLFSLTLFDSSTWIHGIVRKCVTMCVLALYLCSIYLSAPVSLSQNNVISFSFSTSSFRLRRYYSFFEYIWRIPVRSRVPPACVYQQIAILSIVVESTCWHTINRENDKQPIEIRNL